MTVDEREGFRRELRAMGRRLLGRVDELDEEAGAPTGRVGGGQLAEAAGDSGDLSVQQERHDVAVELSANERALLAEVNEALARLDAGTFGACQECGRAVEPERLEALPYTAHCVACARRLQGELDAVSA